MVYEYFSAKNRKLVDTYVTDYLDGILHGVVCGKDLNHLKRSDDLVIDNPLTLGKKINQVIALITKLASQGIRIHFVHPRCYIRGSEVCPAETILNKINEVNSFIISNQKISKRLKVPCIN